MLNGVTVVDLSAPLGPDTIMWPGAPAPSADVVATIADGGFFARLVHVFEHSGTHFDAPCHMVEHTASVDEVPVSSLVAAVRVIDISAEIGDDADGLLSVDDVKAHEAEFGAWFGRVPADRMGRQEHGRGCIRRPRGRPALPRVRRCRRAVPGRSRSCRTRNRHPGNRRGLREHVPGSPRGVAPTRRVAPREPDKSQGPAQIRSLGDCRRAQIGGRIRLSRPGNRAGAIDTCSLGPDVDVGVGPNESLLGAARASRCQ
jgi:hypothetical protein